MATKRFAKHGDADPGQRWESPPVGPDLDYSWHQYGNCDGDPEAQEAIGKVQQLGRRPWAPWCDSCPVKFHCLQQGLAEDELAPSSEGHNYQPYVYGGLAPSERRKLTERDKSKMRSQLGVERWRLRRAAEAS